MGPGIHHGRAAPAAAAALCLLLGVYWGATLAPTQAWGWDETMHAQLPAVRMLLHARAGEWQAVLAVLHDCHQYPFGWPLVLALSQGVFGIGEGIARLSGVACWAATLLLLFLTGRELARAQRLPGEGPRRGDDLLPWLALALGALSPLPLAYAGTLFLEVPFTAGLVLALLLWLRRARPGAGLSSDLLAGAALTAACFLKWNYGLLLAAGLGLDGLFGVALAARGGTGSRALLRLGAVLVVPAVAALWWLVLPLPFGADVAALHREALLGFLAGNVEQPRTEYGLRALHAMGFFALSGRVLAVVVASALAALVLGGARELSRPGARAVFLTLLALGVPILAHPFHLDRFLIPLGPPLWLLAALGLARVLPVEPLRRALVLGGLAALTLIHPTFETRRLAETLIVQRQQPEMHAALRAHVARELERWASLGPGRATPSPGLETGTHERLVELVTGAVGHDERVGWLGVSSELSPAALHMTLLEHGGPPERLLAQAHRPVDVTFTGLDPGWTVEELGRLVAGFDTVLMSDPPDLRGRGAREFVRRYQELLVGELDWQVEELGTLEVERPLAEPRLVKLYAARPPR